MAEPTINALNALHEQPNNDDGEPRANSRPREENALRISAMDADGRKPRQNVPLRTLPMSGQWVSLIVAYCFSF
jgi:hypothetical protein